jgi:hypothetical protein
MGQVVGTVLGVRLAARPWKDTHGLPDYRTVGPGVKEE